MLRLTTEIRLSVASAARASVKLQWSQASRTTSITVVFNVHSVRSKRIGSPDYLGEYFCCVADAPSKREAQDAC